MKLIIQIPCYNEAASLPITLEALPTHVEGFERIETLIIDDGSTDGTAVVAKACFVDHVIQLSSHQGLARAFSAGIDASLKLGADVIVNTDADNQYRGADIYKLVAPILEGKADMVIGERYGPGIDAFSPLKRFLQGFGSWVVRQASQTTIPDATSGFRAFSRDAAMQLNVLSDFSYTLETIIQASSKNLTLRHLAIDTNPPLRPSRLARDMKQYVLRSTSTILRIYAMYQPLRVFLCVGAALAGVGLVLSVRFLSYFFLGYGQGHVQSLILAAVFWIVGFQTMLMGLIADLIAAQRRLSEETLYRVKKLEMGSTGAVIPVAVSSPDPLSH
jgi:glycosyltransferase involved in cell wall biosynthesis